MEMTQGRWAWTSAYLGEVFGREDSFLAGLAGRAGAAGLPAIAVSPDVGRLLSVLTRLAGAGRAQAGPGGRGGMLAVEVGTLGGYSGTWIARALSAGGRLITIESEPKHAAFARRTFDEGGVGERVDIRLGRALDVLPGLAQELIKVHGPAPVDVVFLDALKHEYVDYFRLVRGLIRPGGLLLADNALGGGSWWMDERPGGEQGRERDGVDRFNRMVAGDPDFEAACVPIRQGIMVAVRKG